MLGETILFDRGIPINRMAQIFIERYRSNRYLKDASESDLVRRLNSIAKNILVLDDETGILKPSMNIGNDRILRPIRGLDWLRLVTEVYEEFHIRRIPIPELENLSVMRDCERRLWNTSWAKRPDLINLSGPSLDSYEIPKTIFRYAGKKHNRNLIDYGMIRINPASKYSGENLSSAQQDNETILEIANADGYFEVGNFYVVCFSSIYSYRMYCEFVSDSCVVIKNVPEFERRFNEAIKEFNKKSTDLKVASLTTCPVIYYDPYNISEPEAVDEIRFAKPLQYAYQHEFRLAMTISSPNEIPFIDLVLGPLHDIAEFIG